MPGAIDHDLFERDGRLLRQGALTRAAAVLPGGALAFHTVPDAARLSAKPNRAAGRAAAIAPARVLLAGRFSGGP
jgi:hypothetical protein